MKSVAAHLHDAFRAAIKSSTGLDENPVITPAQERWGDYQCNSAMALAKNLSLRGEKTNPRAVAEKIMAELKDAEFAQELSIAGPGFINVRLKPEWLAAAVQKIHADERLGVDATESPIRVVVDYSGPNIAKQMHVGHLRSTIIGDTITRVIAFLGDEVIRQNHLGDWGTQFGMLIAHLRSLGQSEESHIADLEDFYRAAKKRFDEEPALQDEARATVVRLQAHEPEELRLWQRIVEETRRHYQPIYERLNVKLTAQDERGESFYNAFLAEVVEELKRKQVAVESEGAVAIFVEGFEAPLIIEKSGGGYLYGTTDLAAIRYRTQTLGAKRIIYTHDSRQAQHFKQVFTAASAAGWADGVKLEYAPFGTMLGEDGKPFKSRSGETIKLKDLLDEAEERALAVVHQKNAELSADEQRDIARAVGIGAVKYSDLSKDRVSDYVFSWDKMLSMEGNTAPYLQYAYARIRAILRKAGNSTLYGNIELVAQAEINLAKVLLRFGDVVREVADELKPHLLCTYLFELATAYSSFYENCPVLLSEEQVKQSRLALCLIAGQTLGLGLELLGIEHPERM